MLKLMIIILLNIILFFGDVFHYLRCCRVASTVCLYRVKTVTSKVNYAGTDALVEIQLHGSAATCSWKELNVPGDDNEKGK